MLNSIFPLVGICIAKAGVEVCKVSCICSFEVANDFQQTYRLQTVAIKSELKVLVVEILLRQSKCGAGFCLAWLRHIVLVEIPADNNSYKCY